MENVWTLTEVVRFRLLRPADYDKDFPEEAEEGSIQANPSGELVELLDVYSLELPVHFCRACLKIRKLEYF